MIRGIFLGYGVLVSLGRSTHEPPSKVYNAALGITEVGDGGTQREPSAPLNSGVYLYSIVWSPT